MVSLWRTGAAGIPGLRRVLLGVAEISRAGAQGEPKHPGVPLYAARCEDVSGRGRTAREAKHFSFEAGLPDLQRLRDVAVQEAGARPSHQGAGQLETRDAPYPAPATRNCNSCRWARTGYGS